MLSGRELLRYEESVWRGGSIGVTADAISPLLQSICDFDFEHAILIASWANQLRLPGVSRALLDLLRRDFPFDMQVAILDAFEQSHDVDASGVRELSHITMSRQLGIFDDVLSRLQSRF